METGSGMDKKNTSRGNVLASKSGQEPNRSDFSGRKNGSQYPRKREHEKYDSGKRPAANRGSRTGQRNVRPREKVGGQVGVAIAPTQDSEFGSLQNFGSKKQNITHLLNWWGPGPADQQHWRHGKLNHSRRTRNLSYHKYNKEHFLQANCQFVVTAGEDYSNCKNDPDHLVDWDLVEEVRLHMSEPPGCPICLYPPSAAKVTRCGHIFCFSCLLHYLALSDDKWRKCPICFEAIHKNDLKSVVAILHKDCSPGDEIEFQLMRRDRDSLVPVPVSYHHSNGPPSKVVSYSSSLAVLPFSKLIIATKREVSEFILEREIKDLQCQLAAEGDQPEVCFVQEAMTLLNSRRSSLSEGSESSSSPSDFSPSRNLAEGGDLPNLTSTLSEFSFADASPPSGGGPDSCLAHPQCQTASLSSNQEGKNAPKQTFYFYQACNGAHVYLHTIDVQMLIRQYGSLEQCPLTIRGKILEKETTSMNEDLRQRLRYLRHLPVTCNFDIVEVELKDGIVSQNTSLEFQERLEQRAGKRKKRAKEERKFELKARAVEDRLMGRSHGAKLNLSSEKHFPTFSEDPPLVVGSMEQGSEAPNPPSPPEASAPPSFAQLIRKGGGASSGGSGRPAWPSLGNDGAGAWAGSSASAIQSPRKATASADGADSDEGERVPDYNTSFSDAFARALDEAAKKTVGDVPSGGGKKRKKKRILLLSSGGY